MLSSADLERYENEVDRANKKEILDQVAKNLPVQCRTIAGGLCPHMPSPDIVQKLWKFPSLW